MNRFGNQEHYKKTAGDIKEAPLSVVDDIGAKKREPSDFHCLGPIVSSFSWVFSYQIFSSFSLSNLIAGVQAILNVGTVPWMVKISLTRSHIWPDCLSRSTEYFSSLESLG